MLPDSHANEPASHGLVQFTMNQNSSNGIGTVIENTAAIYFDSNPVITTNTVVNTIVTTTDILESENLLNTIKVFPNPSNGLFTIDVTIEKENKISMNIYVYSVETFLFYHSKNCLQVLMKYM